MRGRGRFRRRGGRRGGHRGGDDSAPQEKGSIDLYDEDYSSDGSSSSDEDSKQPSSHSKHSHKSGKQLYYEQNKHRFDMNYEVLQWNWTDLNTIQELDPVRDYFTNVESYCDSFLDYVFEETRAEILQSIQTRSHGDIARCKISKWKKGKNKGDAASVTFEIIPKQSGYITMFQKHDYVIVAKQPNISNLEKEPHFFAIIEEGNQLNAGKFQQQSQPWLRHGNTRRRGQGRRFGGKGRKHGGHHHHHHSHQHSTPQTTSNLSTKVKAKFVSNSTTKHLLNMEASKGKKAGKKVYHNNADDYSGNNWFVIPVYSMVTKHREYESIQRCAVPSFLSETWIRAPKNQKGNKNAVSSSLSRAENIAPGLKQYLQTNYNPAQCLAIEQVLNDVSKKVHLIHGPPGSGKTSVLLGLITALLANKQRVLVCSGTNVAVDHVVIKMAKNGLRNSNGERYDLSINKMARIGNDEKIDPLSKKIDPATRFKKLVKLMKEIQAVINNARLEQFEIMEKTRNTKSAFNAKNSIQGRTDKIVTLLNNVAEYITQLSTTKLVNMDLVTTMLQQLEKVKEKMSQFLSLGKKPEVKKIDLEEGAKATYDEMDLLHTECQKYLIIDNRDVEKKILDNCDLVFATLAITGRHVLRDCRKFDVLIIDEAAQVTESESMIPLDLITQQVVLIGDPQQLPSTVISQEAINKGYHRSMFERIMKISKEQKQNGVPTSHEPVLLDTQYRMHPSISKFPEHTFYNSLLKDGENVKHYHEIPLWKERYENGLPSCLFLNVPDSKERFNESNKSIENEIEADLIVKYIDMLMTKYKVKKQEIAIITFYRAQVDLIRTKLNAYEQQKKAVLGITTDASAEEGEDSVSESGSSDSDSDSDEEDDTQAPSTDTSTTTDATVPKSAFGEEEDEDWFDVNTVDSYQGSEKQICILSTVRANNHGALGFCVDPRRLNVAVTRAQFSLTIIGNGENLCKNDLWKQFVRNVSVMEPIDIPELHPTQVDEPTTEKREVEPLLIRCIKRGDLALLSSVLKSKFLKKQKLDSEVVIKLCIQTKNASLLKYLLDTDRIFFVNGTNWIHSCLEQRSYECALVFLFLKQAVPLLLQKDSKELLPIQSCIFKYATEHNANNKDHLQALFLKICKVLSKYTLSQEERTNLGLETTSSSFFDVKDKYGQTVLELVVNKKCGELLREMVTIGVVNAKDEKVVKLAKDAGLDKFLEPAIQPQPQLPTTSKSQEQQPNQQKQGKQKPSTPQQKSTQQPAQKNTQPTQKPPTPQQKSTPPPTQKNSNTNQQHQQVVPKHQQVVPKQQVAQQQQIQIQQQIHQPASTPNQNPPPQKKPLQFKSKIFVPVQSSSSQSTTVITDSNTSQPIASAVVNPVVEKSPIQPQQAPQPSQQKQQPKQNKPKGKPKMVYYVVSEDK